MRAHEITRGPRGRGLRRLLMLGLATLVVGCTGKETEGGDFGDLGELSPAPCGPLASGQVEGKTAACGFLEVPVDWDAPSADRYRLHVTWLKAASATGLKALVLLGGPGDVTDQFVGNSTPAFVNALGHDLIFFDQRGTGRSQPAPRCDELAGLELTAYGPALAACKARLQGQGVSLDSFNTIDSAHDVDALRRAVGAQQVALVGLSYGTRLALQTLRLHPDGVGALVLDSVTPPHLSYLEDGGPGVDAAIDSLIQACASDPSCDAASPSLGARLDETLAGLPVPWASGPGGSLTRETYVGALIQLQGRTPVQLGQIPGFLTQVHADVTQAHSVSPPTSGALEQVVHPGTGYDVAMYYSVTCADTQYADPAKAAEKLASIRPGLVPYFQGLGGLIGTLCADWPKKALDPTYFTPVGSQVPSLVLNAEFDTLTPAVWAQAAAAGLSASTTALFPGAAHIVVTTDPSDCALGLVKELLDAPGSTPNTACAKQ